MGTKKANHVNQPTRLANFVVELTDPQGEMFADDMAASRATFQMTKKSLEKTGWKIKKREELRSEVNRILELRGMGEEERIRSLSEIIMKKKTRSTKRYGKDGTLVETVVSEPNFSDIIKAVEVLNKMAGTYDKNRAASDMAKMEYKTLLKKLVEEDAKADRARPLTPEECEEREVVDE